MGFFQDLKQDLSQAVNEMVPEEGEVETGDLASKAEVTSSEDLFGQTDGEDFADLEAMLENEATALGSKTQEPKEEVVKQPKEEIQVEPQQAEQANDEVEELLNEVEQNLSDQVSSMERKTEPDFRNTRDMSFFASTSAETSSDTAVITAGMTITGDVISSGNMDLIGNINGNIEINGKLNVTGSINGNSSAAEIYAESAQINGEVKSKGSVKIGQSSVVIGNIFATSAVIAGAVKGDIDVHGPVVLDTSAIVMGNIKSKSVQINNGAVIEGMCSQCYADVSPTSFFDDYKPEKRKAK